MKVKSVKFVAAKHDLQFKCEWAVYPAKGESSVCYCTSEERAEIVAKAMTMFWNSEEGQKHINAK